jgi:RNA polymerase sigma factor (sigma-70 family)
MDLSDHDLLRQFAHDGSQTAFAELVRRHLDLVYSAARRQVQSPPLAEEIAQTVFLDLSRNALRITPATPLVAWLHVVTRRTAIDTIRKESRRQVREKTALEITGDEPSEADAMKTIPVWKQVEPLLDEALEELSETDRSAVLLRFFENKNFREIGLQLGISDDTAQKRVARALDRLRGAFATRGVTVGSTTLAAEFAVNAMQAAPPGLAASIATATALPLGALALESVAAGANPVVVATAPKIAMAIVAATLLGAAGWEVATVLRQRTEIAAISARADRLDAELRALRRERDSAAGEMRHTKAEIARLSSLDVDVDAEVAAWLARVAQLRKLAAQRPEQTLPEFAMLREKDWFDAAREAKFETEEDLIAHLASLRRKARERLAPRLRAALMKFVDAHDGQLPDDIAQLSEFTEAPLDSAILARYELLQRGDLANLPRETWLIVERTSIDEANDTLLHLTRWAGGVMKASEVRQPDLRAALQAYLGAHGGQFPSGPAQLLPFFARQPSPVALKAFLEKPSSDFTPAELQKLLPSD